MVLFIERGVAFFRLAFQNGCELCDAVQRVHGNAGEADHGLCDDAAGGWRPRPTKALEEKHPLVWALIQQCWRSESTKIKGGLKSMRAADVAKRPTFVEIVKSLEFMAPSDGRVQTTAAGGEAI